MQRRPRVMIVSNRDDLHVFAVKAVLEERYGEAPFYLCADAAEDLTICHDQNASTILSNRECEVDVGDLDVIWWRRFPRLQKGIRMQDAVQQDLLERDWSATLRGALQASFKGIWVSHPDSTDAASLKLTQLILARAAGLQVPQTIVTNCPERVRSFMHRFPSGVVAKTVKGTAKSAIFTAEIREEDLPADESISLSPTIYQEVVSGSRHLRIVILGADIYSGLIETHDLDWRKRVPSSIVPYEIDSELASKLLEYQRLAGLRMGIVDMKIDDHRGPVWLENNPQGQFLFVEGLSGIPLAAHCASFLQALADGRAKSGKRA